MYSFTCEHLLTQILTDRDDRRDILQSGLLSAETAEAIGVASGMSQAVTPGLVRRTPVGKAQNKTTYAAS